MENIKWISQQLSISLVIKEEGNNLIFFNILLSAIPTNFDCSLGSTYGYVAATLIACHCTIYLASVRGLLNPPS